MILFVVLVACTAGSAEHLSDKPYYVLDNATNLFNEFVQKYNKVYNPEEYLKRIEIFKDNLKEIIEHNAKYSGVKYGINHFADLTAEEREPYFGFKPVVDSFHDKAVHLDISHHELTDLPDSFDWRDHIAVTRVKEQGICGSGWIFSAIGSIETQYAIKYNKSIELSEQQALDCIKPHDQLTNCHGGWPHNVMVHNKDGAMTENDYNYTGNPGACSEDLSKAFVKVDSVMIYRPTDDTSLQRLLIEKGPLVVALQGLGLTWYNNGVAFNFFQCIGAINHVMLLVGYGVDEGLPHWILKNSWGESWGEQGYLRLQRGGNTCFLGTSYTAVCTVA